MQRAGIVDWDALYELVHGPVGFSGQDPEAFWEPHGAMYDQMSRMEADFLPGLLDVMDLRPDDTVIDVGCGAGRLAVPVADRVRRVIAVDAAPSMLARTRALATERDADNVETVHGDWHDPELRARVGRHDVVLTSRTELLWEPELLVGSASRRVYLSHFADGPSLREVQLGLFTGIPGYPTPIARHRRELGYNVAFNRLYDRGVDPSIVIVPSGFRARYADRAAAYDDLVCLGDLPTGSVPVEHLHTFRANADTWLRDTPGGGVEFLRTNTTYVLWWDVSPQPSPPAEGPPLPRIPA